MPLPWPPIGGAEPQIGSNREAPFCPVYAVVPMYLGRHAARVGLTSSGLSISNIATANKSVMLGLSPTDGLALCTYAEAAV